ncbi:hypothetical protein BGZ96_001198, partial [Linnemannia gamsii]
MTQKQISRRSWPTYRPFPIIRVVKDTEFSGNPSETESSASFPYFGAVDRDGLRALSCISEFLDTKRDMEDTIAWLQDADLHNQHEKLTRTFPEGMAKFLSYGHIDTVLHSVEGMHRIDSKTCFFVFDLQVLQGFVDAAQYGHCPLANWNTNRLEQALDLQNYIVANPECVARTFTVSCRSSMGEEVTTAAVVHAAKSDKAQRFIHADEWVKGPARFPVLQQHDSVYCGLVTLSAIEYSINWSCELWSQ